jgi:DUF971 family protein
VIVVSLPESIENEAAPGVLVMRWPDATAVRFTHAQLRRACPCSECRAARRAGLTVEAPAGVRLAAIEPVGVYALNLVFNDGHKRGIYPFDFLAELAAEPA